MMGPIETLGWMVGAIIKFVLTPTLMMVRGATWWMTILVTSIGGLWGLLAISGLISVPIASILAAKYHSKDPRMPWLLVFAFVVWSFILTTLSLLLGETNPPQ